MFIVLLSSLAGLTPNVEPPHHLNESGSPTFPQETLGAGHFEGMIPMIACVVPPAVKKKAVGKNKGDKQTRR